jgi:transketolase
MTVGEPLSVVTRPFAQAFVNYAHERPQVVCLTNDLTVSVEADAFRATFPDRYYSMGMAEQNLISAAGGMAREGLVPFYPTFSVFATRRPYEQIALSVAYPNLPVRIMGFLPGLTTPGGVTHQATDDIALMRGLPNMTVLELGDATEVESVWPVFDQVPGPVFCRVPRGEVPRLFDEPIILNRARVLEEGRDVLVLTAGITTQTSLPAIRALRAVGIDVGHLHISTLKPLTDSTVLEHIGRARRGIVTVENHLVHGGLGSAIAEVIAERGIGTRLVRVGIRDTFTHGGSTAYLFEYYRLMSWTPLNGWLASPSRWTGMRSATRQSAPSTARLSPRGSEHRSVQWPGSVDGHAVCRHRRRGAHRHDRRGLRGRGSLSRPPWRFTVQCGRCPSASGWVC